MSEPALDKPVLTQVALVVRDIEATASAYADLLGVDIPPVRLTGTQDETDSRYHGEPTEARAKLAFFQLGGVSLELIEPVGGPSTWAEHLEKHGEGVHHLAFRTEDMDGTIGKLEGKGLSLAQRGNFQGGCYAYMDAEPLHIVLELLAKR